jgi:hypothetical protein
MVIHLPLKCVESAWDDPFPRYLLQKFYQKFIYICLSHEDHRLRVVDIRVLMRIFGPKRKEWQRLEKAT